MAFISFHFFDWQRRPGSAVWAIYFSGKGPTSELQSCPLLEELRSRLRVYQWGPDGKSLMAMSSSDSRPSALLGELDRIAAAFGSSDRHRAPRSRSRSTGKRLAAVSEAVLRNARWDLHNLSLWIWADANTNVNISAIPKLSSMMGASKTASSARVSRARAHGYTNRSGKDVPMLALLKLQPLSLRAALAEATFLESELSA
jgi:hypothetical protein